MKHFSISQWADFVRDLGDRASRSAMEAHLFLPCPPCQRTVKVLRDVAVTARREADYEPPEHAIRCAEAIYSLSRPEKAGFPRLVARLVHDSLREPLPAGMRAQSSLSRHALYEAGSYYLDLQLEQQRTSGLVTLLGQLADRKKPAASTADVPVWLMDRKRVVTTTFCNRLGEFQLEYAPASRLRLCVPLREARKRLEVSLNSLTPGPPSSSRPAKITQRPSRRKGGA